MISRLSHTTIWVEDQDAAKDFYVESLGFDVRTDVTMDGFRWLTVGPKDQPDLEMILLRPGPPMMDEDSAAQLLTLVRAGAIGGGVLDTDDCRATFEELSARGVSSCRSPPNGRTASGRVPRRLRNWFSLRQRSS